MPSNMSENDYSMTNDDDVYVPMTVEFDSKSNSRGKRSSITGSRIDRRRQVHVRCEHRRRKEIQESLDALEAELPGQVKRRSKGDIISDSAEMIKELTFTLDRLLNENQALLNRAQVNEYTK